MAVTIYPDIGRNVFSKVAALYLGDTQVVLRDSTGTVLVGAEAPVAPTISRQPSILPQSAAIGDSVTLDIGTAEGLPAPVATWDILLNGVSIRSRLDDGAMTLEIAEAGVYELVVNWVNSADAAQATPAALTVMGSTVPETPVVNYATAAMAYIDASATFEGTAADVTSVSAIGTGAYLFTKAGTGATVQRTADGFVFGNGVYLQSQMFSNQPSTDGLFAVADITLTSYGANIGQILDGTGVNMKLRNSSGALQALGPVAGQGALALGTVAYGARVVIAGRLDDLLDVLSGVNSSGAAVTAVHTGLTDPSPTRFATGRYVNGTLHRLAIVGRPEGQPWPVTMEEVVADFRRGA